MDEEGGEPEESCVEIRQRNNENIIDIPNPLQSGSRQHSTHNVSDSLQWLKNRTRVGVIFAPLFTFATAVTCAKSWNKPICLFVIKLCYYTLWSASVTIGISIVKRCITQTIHYRSGNLNAGLICLVWIAILGILATCGFLFENNVKPVAFQNIMYLIVSTSLVFPAIYHLNGISAMSPTFRTELRITLFHAHWRSILISLLLLSTAWVSLNLGLDDTSVITLYKNVFCSLIWALIVTITTLGFNHSMQNCDCKFWLFIAFWSVLTVEFCLLLGTHALVLIIGLLGLGTFDVYQSSFPDAEFISPCAEDFSPRTTVKAVDFHPTEPNLLIAAYHSGAVVLWDCNNGISKALQLIEGTNRAVRSVKFLDTRFFAGGDDGKLHVVDIRTLEVIISIQAHSDFIRSIDISGSTILSSSDDMTIKLWAADNLIAPPRVFRDHTHWVMQVRFNTAQCNIFASASCDTTVRLWDVAVHEDSNTTTPLIQQDPLENNTSSAYLEGHTHCVNCIEFCGEAGELLISGSDDKTIRVWTWKTGDCIFESRSSEKFAVTSIVALPKTNQFLTTSEYGPLLSVWSDKHLSSEWACNFMIQRSDDDNSSAYPQRNWAISAIRDLNKSSYDFSLAVGTDEGVIQCQMTMDISLTKQNYASTFVLDNPEQCTGSTIEVQRSTILENVQNFIETSTPFSKEVSPRNADLMPKDPLPSPLFESESTECSPFITEGQNGNSGQLHEFKNDNENSSLLHTFSSSAELGRTVQVSSDGKTIVQLHMNSNQDINLNII